MVKHSIVIRAIALGLITWIACPLPAAAAPRQVVVIYDERTSLPGLAAVDASIADTLSSAPSGSVQIYNEAMDLSRFDQALRLRYSVIIFVPNTRKRRLI